MEERRVRGRRVELGFTVLNRISRSFGSTHMDNMSSSHDYAHLRYSCLYMITYVQNSSLVGLSPPASLVSEVVDLLIHNMPLS